jgi:hypothetical protein
MIPQISRGLGLRGRTLSSESSSFTSLRKSLAFFTIRSRKQFLSSKTSAHHAACSEEVLLTWQSGSGVVLTSSDWAFSATILDATDYIVATQSARIG